MASEGSAGAPILGLDQYRWDLLLQEFNFEIEYNKGGSHKHVDIFSQDVAPDPEADSQVKQVATKANVFALQQNTSALTIHLFPSYDELLGAQQSECTEEVVEKYKLRKGPQGLYQPPRGQQVYIPLALRKNIMYYLHYGSRAAHQEVNKAFNRIRKLFRWPGLRNDLQQYHNHCLTCARRRPKPATSQRRHLLAPGLGHVVAIDIVQPLATSEGPVNLLTIVDHFSRYAHACALQEVTSEAIWNGLFQTGSHISEQLRTSFRITQLCSKVIS